MVFKTDYITGDCNQDLVQMVYPWEIVTFVIIHKSKSQIMGWYGVLSVLLANVFYASGRAPMQNKTPLMSFGSPVPDCWNLMDFTQDRSRKIMQIV